MQFDEVHRERNPGARSGFEKYIIQARRSLEAFASRSRSGSFLSDNALAEE
jgi:hypothetical protein